MITYSLNDLGIFCVNFEGTVTMDDIKKFLGKFRQLTGLPDHLLAFYDLREAEMKLNSEDIMLISQITEEHLL